MTSPSKHNASQSHKGSLVKPRRGDEPVQYHSYLSLDTVLNAQKPKSWVEGGTWAHDEHLFIVTHQASELWFKQILHDIGAVMECMGGPRVEEREMGKILERLRRVSMIQGVLINHLSVLETMSPLSFLEFREYLFPASGFQSMQFRQLEVRLGLRRNKRLSYAGTQYDCALTPEQAEEVRELESQTSLFELVDQWLARTPVLHTPDFDFWSQYQQSVRSLLREERDAAEKQFASGRTTESAYQSRLADLATQVKFFDTFFDRERYEEQRERGEYRLSYEACQAALMINFYQEEPLFQVPYQFLSLLMEIDEQLGQWRAKHAAMVHRMLGLKMGTGGSSGYVYLLGTIKHHRIFHELCNLASLMVPRSYLPPLPESVSKMTTFNTE